MTCAGGYADACIDADILAPQAYGWGETLAYAISHTDSVTYIPYAIQQNGELIPTQAGDDIFLGRKMAHAVNPADAVAQTLGDRNQQFISSVVAQTVIDDLETIHVEEQQGADISRVTLGTLKAYGEPIQKETPVGQSGKWIMQGRSFGGLTRGVQLFVMPLQFLIAILNLLQHAGESGGE
jgi:hypothetical protein